MFHLPFFDFGRPNSWQYTVILSILLFSILSGDLERKQERRKEKDRKGHFWGHGT